MKAKWTGIFLLAGILGCAEVAFAQTNVADTIGALRSRYASLRLRARTLSSRLGHPIEPLRIIDAMARRFVNRPDWERFVRDGGTDPRQVYDPKPATWNNWQRVAEAEVQAAAASGTPLSLQMLLSWNGDAIMNTVPDFVHGGELKSTPNFGKNVTRDTALDAEQVQALLSIRFEGDTASALGWVPLVCEEALSRTIPLPGPLEDCQQIAATAQQYAGSSSFWADTQRDLSQGLYQDRWYWYACWPRESAPDPRGTCGMIVYPDPQRAPRILAGLIDRVNGFFEHSPTDSDSDPIRLAATVQRQMVALHPFNKGNGRVSRWVMDYVLLRSGLPPALVRNMDYDLSTPEETYVHEAQEGVNESIRRMSRCLDRYQARGYQAMQGTICGLVEDLQ